MNYAQRTRMIELDQVARAAQEAQLNFTPLVYPKGCLVKVHHSRGALNARENNYSMDGHQLIVVNCQTGKATYAYPSSRTDTFKGEAWASHVEFLEGQTMSNKGIFSVPMILTEQQERDILRFYDTCEDGQGYDVPKDRMKSLASLGLILTTGFSRYEITDAGGAVIEELRTLLDAPSVEYGPTPGCKQCQEAEGCGLTDCPECDAKLSEDVDGTGVRPTAQPQSEGEGEGEGEGEDFL